MVDRILNRGRDAKDGDAATSADATEDAPPVDPKAANWARVQLARNLRRPRTLEFLAVMADEFIELHGDRLFGDDEAVVAGFARIGDHRVAVIGQQKGADTEENVRRAHAGGIQVHVWTVNTQEAMTEFIALGVDGIITNHPDLLIDLLKRKAAK